MTIPTKFYPRESVEFHPCPLLEDGVAYTGDRLVAVTAWRERPTTFAAATEVDDEFGVMVSGYQPGYYRTWCKVTDNPESPVVESEPFAVT